MDLIPSSLVNLLNTIQNAQQAELPATAPLPALMALAGQDVLMTLLGQTASGGVSLGLPSGQVITAQGQMPFAEGSTLLVRILASGTDGPVQLQTLQATPPAAPAILAPLLQGEAAGLQSALSQAEPPAGLEPLAQLFRMLGGATAPDAGLPEPSQVQAAVAALPAQTQAALRTLLDLPADSAPADLANALGAWISGARTGPAPAAGADPAALLQRLQGSADRHPELPAGQVDNLAQVLKNLVDPGAAKAATGQERAAPAPGSPAQALQTLLGDRARNAPAVPDTWESWIRTSIKALADPQVSPQTAPFHAAQAKEGTAFYEIPLPWAPQSPLQVWVESERNPKDQGHSQPDDRRVLLGLTFSNLGETRLGLAQHGADLQVRVWAEHPQALEAARPGVEQELRELGGTVDLKIMPLLPEPGGAIPSLRSLVTGSTLEALG